MAQVRNLNIILGWSQIDLEQDDWKLEIRKFKYYTVRRFNDLYNWVETLALPEYTTTQRYDLDSPQNGQMIYNSTTNRVEIRQNGAWVYITNVSSA